MGDGEKPGGVTLKVNEQGGSVGVLGIGGENSGQIGMEIDNGAGRVSVSKEEKTPVMHTDG